VPGQQSADVIVSCACIGEESDQERFFWGQCGSCQWDENLLDLSVTVASLPESGP
jgi:hypothetical protein